MGMAASQARLLTITARLNNIELQSQNISNAKIRLANATDTASDKYVKALNKTNYVYNNYNLSGQLVSTNLTGAALTQYGELKNQYGLINSAGQILVSERDAANFQNSNTLEEFLDKYGVLADISEGITIEYVNPVWVDTEADYEEKLAEWQANQPDPNDPKYTTLVDVEDNELYNKCISAFNQCGCWSGEGNPVEFNHVEHLLAKMLDYDKDYTAYPGTDKEATYHKVPGGAGSAGNQGGAVSQSNEWTQASENIMIEVRDKIKNNQNDPNLWQDCVNLYYESLKTISNYFGNDYLAMVNGTDNGQPAMSTDELGLAFYDANEGDGLDSIVERLKVAFQEEKFDQEAYDADVADWEAQKPVKDETIQKYLPKTVRVATDLDEAQWYVNLWNRMNGVSNFKGGFGNNGAYDPDAGWASKSTTDQSWAVLKDGDMNSPEYLKYAIENGLITLEQVQFTDISASEQGIKNASWVSIIFSNAQDITEVKDEEAIAKAEVEYTKTLKEIEIKDKQYDTDLKKLDTEHNALQTEYDSIKTVLQKNVERSFKTFNG